MNRRSRVRIVQRACDRSQQRDDTERLVPYARLEDVIERPARDHLGDEVRRLSFICKLVQAWNRLVLERHIRSELQEEPARKADVARHICADGPHGDPALEARMLGLVYRSQAVGFDFAQDTVAAHAVMTVTRSLGPESILFG